MKKIHYGWLVCAGCALLLFCTSGLSINAFTVYQPYIMAQNGFTNAQSSAIITFRSLSSFLGMLLTGFYYKKLSLRTGMGAAGGLLLAGFVTYAFAESHFAYCLGSTLVGFGYGFGTMIPIAMVLGRWFAAKRTFALGICSAVTGFSTLGIPSLLTGLVEKYGLRHTFLLESGCIALLVAAAVLLIRSDPGELGLQPYGAAPEEDAAPAASGPSVLTGKYWLLIVPMLLLLGAMTNVGYSHLSVLLSSQGFDGQLTALAITVSGITLTLGKYGYGWLSDRVGTYHSNRIFGAVLTLGMTLCCVMGSSPAVMLAAMVCYGAGLATTTVGLNAWAGDLSSPDQYNVNVRRFQLGYSGGTLLFSSLPGVLADRFGGSYVPAYLFFVFCTLFVLGSVQWLYRDAGKHR